jgi:hypothetical protein
MRRREGATTRQEGVDAKRAVLKRTLQSGGR